MHSQATILLVLSVVGTVLLSACQVVPAPGATVTAAAPDRVVGEMAAREIASPHFSPVDLIWPQVLRW